MAIVNRDVDVSQQKDVVQAKCGAVATGVTLLVAVAPYPCTVQSIRTAALGVSNAMQLQFLVQRFIVGSGSTIFTCGISNLILSSIGTSGTLGYSGLAAAGSTLLNLGAGDALMALSSVANGNATDLLLEVVLKKTQDVVSHNGVSS